MNTADIKRTLKELVEGGNTAQERYDLAVKLERQAAALKTMCEVELIGKNNPSNLLIPFPQRLDESSDNPSVISPIEELRRLTAE